MVRRIAALSVLVLLSADAAAAAEGADPMPTAKVRAYAAYSNGTEYTRGRMRLSTRSAAFSRLKGRMTLEPAGTMPSAGSFETDGATVFRVVDAEAFFKANRSRNGFCDAPIRWLAVRALPSGVVRVAFLTIADFRDYDPSKPGLCSGDSYALD